MTNASSMTYPQPLPHRLCPVLILNIEQEESHIDRFLEIEIFLKYKKQLQHQSFHFLLLLLLFEFFFQNAIKKKYQIFTVNFNPS